MYKRLAIGGLLLLVLSFPIFGQRLVEILLVRVALDEPTPKKLSLGDDLTFRVKAGFPLPGNFHVRIFRGTLDYNRREMKSHADSQGCILYTTALLYGVADSVIHLGTLSDPGWLASGPDGRFAAEDLVVVFEAGGHATELQIRLHKDQVDTYFKYAVPVRLSPSVQTESASAQLVQATQRAHDEQRIVLAQLPQGPCYNVLPASSSSIDQQEIVVVAAVRPATCGTVAAKDQEIKSRMAATPPAS